MKFIRKKRTPKIKIEELELRHFPTVGAIDPYWNDLYNPGQRAGSEKPNVFK